MHYAASWFGFETEVALAEYHRRGCPLTHTAWSIFEVSIFMKTYIRGKDRNADLGAYSYFFGKGTRKQPATMPDFLKQMDIARYSADDDDEHPTPQARGNVFFVTIPCSITCFQL